MNRSAAMKAVWARKRSSGTHRRGPKKGHECKHGRKPDGYCRTRKMPKNKAAMRLQAFIRKRQEKRRAENYRKYSAARGF